MNFKVIEPSAQSTFAIIFDKNDELIAGLTALAKEKNFAGSRGGSTRTSIQYCCRWQGILEFLAIGVFNRKGKNRRRPALIE